MPCPASAPVRRIGAASPRTQSSSCPVLVRAFGWIFLFSLFLFFFSAALDGWIWNPMMDGKGWDAKWRLYRVVGMRWCDARVDDWLIRDEGKRGRKRRGIGAVLVSKLCLGGRGCPVRREGARSFRPSRPIFFHHVTGSRGAVSREISCENPALARKGPFQNVPSAGCWLAGAPW